MGALRLKRCLSQALSARVKNRTAIGRARSQCVLRKLPTRTHAEIAQIIVDHLPENAIIKSVDIAGPGFINFTLEPSSFQAVVRTVRDLGEEYGQVSAHCSLQGEP